MAQHRVQLDKKTICCCICVDVLKDPVTVPCGHNYCMKCIKSFWDGEDVKKIYSCPQCQKTFKPRPVLMKNTMLADLVEEVKNTGLQAAPADHCYAGAEDVSCDFCTGKTLTAFKSCLVCLVSYCEKHLQPHYESPDFEKHKLVEPSKQLQSIFAVVKNTEKERELEGSRLELEGIRLNIQQRMQDRKKDVKLLQQEVEAVNHFADEAVEDSEKIFTKLIHLLEKRSRDVKQHVRSQQKSEVSGVKELQEKLEKEISKLKRRDTELRLLSHIEDLNLFLLEYTSLSPFSPSTFSINTPPRRYFEDVTAAVLVFRDKLQDVLRETWTNISQTVTEVDVLLPQPEPKTRAEFLKYSRKITLDPNTVNTRLMLSAGDRRATFMNLNQSYPNHPDRFTGCPQVLSSESLTGRCYWEVKWRDCAGVDVAVSYKSIRRDGAMKQSGFGYNNKSWLLDCDRNIYHFWYNNICTDVSGPLLSRIGVYLDHSAGILSFYSVSKTMTLLHRVQTTFTEPLHAGLSLDWGASAEFCKLK